ncbi:E3 ubiquitin-protein ligase ubr1 [Striga asiatica]|uniref:E3 ubiquitin-protein ligase n=1 Tax=Striga asiatica TaxID=4170 RepID=A0A5A7RJC1_STRAF|nr:E3 ubiquitin-protein ligase ubr1 [Striga asiatica]
MLGMEVDSSPEYAAQSHHDLMIQRLLRMGIPRDKLNQGQPGLVEYAKANKLSIRYLFSAIMPSDEEEVDEDVFQESMAWLQWLMFEGDPKEALEDLTRMSSDERGVCGAVWGNHDIAYRCRTCEHDPTCAICVPCFANGDHKDHDYSVIYTGGGCCDCGDITAWKREGFCSKHKGAEQIQPLPEHYTESLAPVLDLLLGYWKRKLLAAKFSSEGSLRMVSHGAELKRVAEELTSTVVEMLLDFCIHSESLLSFISQRVYSSPGLLDILLRAERFIASSGVVGKLHELLLKMLSEPVFKYEFAKAFVLYYPANVDTAVNEGSDAAFKRYPLLPTFSVQILTVPTLTPRLVEGMNLLGVLFQCLENIFIHCAGEDGRLQVTKWANLYETTLRVVEDIRFVLSHSAVPKYLCHQRRDLVRSWMGLLAFVQGMNTLKRETGSHIEDENENIHLPFVLCHSIFNILTLLVSAVFSVATGDLPSEEAVISANKLNSDDQDNRRHAKVGRLSQESSISSITGKGALDFEAKAADSFPVPSLARWFIYECLRAIDNWLRLDTTLGFLSAFCHKTIDGSGNNFLALKRTLSKFRKARLFKSPGSPDSQPPTISSEAHNSTPHGVLSIDVGPKGSQSISQASLGGIDDRLLGESTSELEGLRALKLSDWPDIAYDVSSQEMSMHIPLHRLLSMALRRALKECFGESGSLYVASASSADCLSLKLGDFLAHILDGCHPYGFSAFVMEHPLQIRVFCAQVHAGLWRRNGDAPILFSEWYRSVRWSEQGQELDLFLLQCCAALAPPDLFVQRILERFGLSSYLSLNVEQSSEKCFIYRAITHIQLLISDFLNVMSRTAVGLKMLRCIFMHMSSITMHLNPSRGSELSNVTPLTDIHMHEPVLVTEMVALLIQIVKERRFCGLTTAECLQRELVYKLSMGDATRSQLVKSLPRDLSKVDELQQVLDRVAAYSHPSGMTQGMYKLRSSFWKELDLYHPRWNLRDQQAAEERYLRFCNVSALATQLPRWTKIYHPLKGIAKIAICKTLLQIVRAVLFYASFTDKLATSRAPDGVLCTALHLLALALDVCRLSKESGDPLCYADDVIPILAFASEDISTIKYGEQSLLSLLVLLMRMHEKEATRNMTEDGSFDLSSLISSLIKSLVELEPGCMNKLQKLAPQLANQFSYSVISDNAKGMDLTSDSEKRKQKSRERQAAIMEMMRSQQSKFLESFNSSQDDEMEDAKSEEEECDFDVSNDAQESAQVICSLCHDPKSRSPVSFLVLLQKSRLLSFVNQGPPSWEQVRRSGKEHVSSDTSLHGDLSPTSTSNGSETLSSSQLQDVVQSALNDFASTGQTHELYAIMEFIKARFPSVNTIQLPCTSKGTDDKPELTLEAFEERMYLLIRECQSSCSLRHEEKCSTSGSSKESINCDESLLLGKYIASLPEPVDSPSASQNGRSRRKSESSKISSGSDDFGPSGADGIYVSSCGHAVHQGCLDRYLSSLRERYIRRIVFEGGHIVDPDQGEFLCPVCRGLANSVLPALPGDRKRVSQPQPGQNINFSQACGPSTSSKRDFILHIRDGFSIIQSVANIAGSTKSLKVLPARNVRLKPNLAPIVRLLCEMYYPGQDKILESGRLSHSLILWDTLKYSLISAEISARSKRSSLSPNYSIGDLYKELKNSSCFILSLLLDAVQSTRTSNSQTLLLRLHGLQLFTNSLCRGSYPDELVNCPKGVISNCRPSTIMMSYSSIPFNPSRFPGNMRYILENAELDVQYPDVQFWRQASKPILACDAFSSFMWILFCLPSPLLSCKQSYLSLVHVFYLVAVIQAIIAFCKERQSIETELGPCNNLITDICHLMGECREAVQYFEAHSIHPAYDLKNAVRSLTFPYLRRCALLWKLINSSNMVPFSDGGFDSQGGSSLYAGNDCEYSPDSADELLEIEKLEGIFGIPPLDLVVGDEESRKAALGWLGHFREVLEACKSRRVLRFSPASPLKLMILPNLYQDLLQRYIKKSCPDCGVVKEEPVVCLLCSKLCSPNWKTCCRGSGCQTHAMVCGAGIGVFLLVRRTTILLQRSARQAPWPSPYLDAFGEEDVEMHRGKPLFLNEERYAALTHMVASHGLDRSSKVLGQTTIGSLFLF